MTGGRLRRAWRSPHWWKPVAAIAALLIAVSLVAFAWTSWQYRIDRQNAFERQQAEVVALRAELACRAGESSDATRIESEIARIGWPALAGVVLNGDETQTRHAAEQIDELARQLGPALERRAEAVTTCD